jgi:hypothetical protein
MRMQSFTTATDQMEITLDGDGYYIAAHMRSGKTHIGGWRNLSDGMIGIKRNGPDTSEVFVEVADIEAVCVHLEN